MEKKLRISVLLCLGAFVGSIGAALSPIDFQGVFTVDKTALVPQGSNPFMIVKPGYRLVLTDGEDSLTITVLPETRWVDGVETRVIEERETEGGKLKEVSRNYMAVDRATGDIYYFGEDVDMMDSNGRIVNHEGSWHSGVNGARFGLLIPGQPRVGQRYYQEQAPEVALDRAEIVALDEAVETPFGLLKHCLKTMESSDLERGVEAKWYAPGVGLLRDGDFELRKVEVPVGDTGLPDPVARTFRAAFPLARIDKLDVEAEDGVVVYDFEFADGPTDKETDILGDGTMLEITEVIAAEDLPGAARKAIRQATRGAKLGRIERIEISHEIRDGRAVERDEPVTHYAVEFTRGDKTTEIVVAADGTEIE